MNIIIKKIFLAFFIVALYFTAISQSSDSTIYIKSLIKQGKILLKTDTLSALKNFNKAFVLSKRLKQKELTAELYLETAKILSVNDSLNIAINNYEQAALLYEQANKLEKSCKTYITLANYLFEKSNFNLANKYFTYSLVLFKQNRINDSLKIEALIGSGKVYTKQGNLTQALNYFVQALELSEKTNNNKLKSDSWNQIGVIHWKEGKNNEALLAYKKSLEIREQLKDSIGIAELYNNIGIINKLYKNYSTAYALYIESLKIKRKYNNKKGIAQTLFNIGSLKTEMGLVKEALEYYNQSFTIKTELKDEYGKLPCYLNIGDAYILLNNNIEAEKNFMNGLILAEKLGASDYNQSFHRELSLLFKKQNNFEKAYYHHVKYMELKDTLINISNNSKLAELETKYKISEKQRKIEGLTLEKKLDKEQYNREVYFRNSLIVIILLVLIIIAIVLNRARLLKKKNQTLELQKTIIEQREKEKEVIVREMHHRVKNNLQLISSLLNLQARKINDNEAKESLKQARDRIHAISIIHQKLYSKNDISQINLSDYLPELCNAIIQSNTNQNTKILIKHTIDNVFVSLDIAISIGLIINEAIINSIKHAFNNKNEGLIEISATKNLHIVNLIIKDNGIGIKEVDNTENIGGFGFQLLRSFTTKLSGKIKFENNCGTIINIQIPL